MSFTSDKPIQVNQLPISVDLPQTYAEFMPIMSQLYKRMVDSINSKEGALFSLEELGNFQRYFITTDPQNFRNVYRKVFDVIDENGGSVAAGATVTFAHGITGIVAPTDIYGAATNSDAPPKFLPLPYVSATLVTDQIQIYADATNVTIINGATQTALTQASIVLEYVKTS